MILTYFHFLALAILPLIIAKNVYYDFDAYYISGSPDGVEVNHILSINGQFPGPTITANIGDTVHVTVNNKIERTEGSQVTTIHWHGLFQNGSQFQDGPHMVTQCGIPKGDSQTYVFDVKQAGTYWWHSHVTYQYTEGMYGALIIHNLPEVYDYDEELVIILSDWSHLSGKTNSDWFLSSASGGNEPIPYSGLINGKGSYDCSDTTLPCDPNEQHPPVFSVERGKRYRVRIINTSAMAVFYFSIQGHKLNVIEVDGVDTVQVPLDRIPIAPAQRYSVLVEMNGSAEEYDILAEMSLTMYNFNATNVNPLPEALNEMVHAKLLYRPSKMVESSIDSGSSNSSFVNTMSRSSDDFFPEEMKLQPYDRSAAPNKVDQEIVLDVQGVVDAQGVNHLTFNSDIYTVGTRPVLAQVLLHEPIPDSAQPIYTGHLKAIQVVINNQDTGPHPFHLHGHNFWVLGRGITGVGDFSESYSDQLNLHGVRRDTVVVNAQSWLVFRFITDNPGVWFLHCHINWHLQSGLAATIIEAEDVARRDTEIPEETIRICWEGGVEI